MPRELSVFAFISIMKNYFRTYCKESSIHGLHFIVNPNLHIIEKLLWISMLTVSFICCGFLIFKIGMKFQEDTMVTYTSDTAIAVTDVRLDFEFIRSVFHFLIFVFYSRFPFLLSPTVQIFSATMTNLTTIKSWQHLKITKCQSTMSQAESLAIVRHHFHEYSRGLFPD
jgi:hypothetical protein